MQEQGFQDNSWVLGLLKCGAIIETGMLREGGCRLQGSYKLCYTCYV